MFAIGLQIEDKRGRVVNDNDSLVSKQFIYET
jgi:hypothetical protein